MSTRKTGAMAPNKQLDDARKREGNRLFTKAVIDEFRKTHKIGAVKTIAARCGISPNTVNEWFCKGQGINGIHLALLEREFPFIREYVDQMWREGKLKLA